MIKALLFDMDGLIFDTEALYKVAWQKATKEQGIELTDDLYQNFIGVQDPECERMLELWFAGKFDLLRFQKHRDEYLAQLKHSRPEYKQGFKSLFYEAKKRRLKTALVTSSFLEEVKSNFSDSIFLTQFDTVITAESVKKGKPEPDCYLMACSKLNIEATHCLVLEDSNNGMLAGLNAGCQAVMVPDLLPANNEVKERALYIFDTLDMVVQIL